MSGPPATPPHGGAAAAAAGAGGSPFGGAGFAFGGAAGGGAVSPAMFGGGRALAGAPAAAAAGAGAAGGGAKPYDAVGVARVQHLISTGEQLISQFQMDKAIVCLSEALKIEPTNATAWSVLGHAYLDNDQHELAEKAFESSARLAPDTDSDKWLNLGQLKEGLTALKCYEKGVQLLIKEREAAASKEEGAALARQVSSAFVAMAEIWTNDLGENAEADAKAEQLLTQAVKACAPNPESWQAMAWLRLNQERTPEAVQCFAQALTRLSAIADDAEELPPYAFRVQTVKLAIELKQFGAPVLALCEKLLGEDDRHSEIWFLTATVYKGAAKHSLALKYAQRCMQMVMRDGAPEHKQMTQALLTECQQLHAANPTADDDEDDGGAAAVDDDDADDAASDDDAGGSGSGNGAAAAAAAAAPRTLDGDADMA